MGHFPGFDSAITACTGQLQTESSRTGTRSILQIGQVPFLSSRMSGCIGQRPRQRRQAFALRTLCRGSRRLRGRSRLDASARANRRAAGLITTVLCYTPTHVRKRGGTRGACRAPCMLLLAALARPAQSARNHARVSTTHLDAFLAAPSRDAAARHGRRPRHGPASASTRRFARCSAGGAYGPGRPASSGCSNRTADGVEHHFVAERPRHLRSGAPLSGALPPARRRQRRARPTRRRAGTIGALAGAEQIYIMPYAWNDAPWWSDDQVAEPGGDPRRHQAALQRRREPRRGVGRLGRRHRRLLGRDARDDAVCELPAAQRLLDGAREPATSTTACSSPTTCATSRCSSSTAGAIGCIRRPSSIRISST